MKQTQKNLEEKYSKLVGTMPYYDLLNAFKIELITAALQISCGSVGRAAKLLKINRTTLYAMIIQFDLLNETQILREKRNAEKSKQTTMPKTKPEPRLLPRKCCRCKAHGLLRARDKCPRCGSAHHFIRPLSRTERKAHGYK